MAMICRNGARECTGCMECLDGEVRELYCPACGKKIYEDSQMFEDKRSGDILGCERCIKVHYAEEIADRL